MSVIGVVLVSFAWVLAGEAVVLTGVVGFVCAMYLNY
jgi:hypothetical protein